MSRLLSVAEAAERASNSTSWWRKFVARGGIEVVRLGRAVRLREADVDRVLREGVRPKAGA